MTASKTASKSQSRTALVTGASLGIGLELARQLAAGGHDLVLVARSEDKLRQLATELARDFGIAVHVIASDLSRPDAARQVFAETTRLGLIVDILVNNAGYGLYGRFLDLDAAEDARMLQLNMITLTEMARLYAAGMVERRHGRILNVASTAAFQPGPLMSTYYATKAYVLSFSEALANELRDQGVTVTALCPGPTRSGFQDKAQMQGSRILTLSMMDAASVARLGYEAMLSGRPVVVTGVMNRMFAHSIRFMPRCIVTRMSRFIAERTAA